MPEIAVWSGDTVRRDEEGFLYFISRRDEMIKTSGYRVSPTEVEEVVYATGLVGEAAAFGVPHPTLGQAIVVVATARRRRTLDTAALLAECQHRLPAYMVPAHVASRAGSLPRNPNGKIDRKLLAQDFLRMFEDASALSAPLHAPLGPLPGRRRLPPGRRHAADAPRAARRPHAVLRLRPAPASRPG